MTTLDITEVRGSTRRELLTFIRNNAGATSETISAALGKPANHYTGTLRTMFEDNLISRQRDGRSFRYFIPDRAPTAAEQAEPTDAELDFNLSATLDKELIEDMRNDLAEMEAEIDALEAWKADAIKRYPDLGPVDPLLVKAREIAVRGGWMDWPDAGITETTITNGDFDNHPIVQAIYTTLQEA
jgi:hypothetical protein